MMQRIVLVTLLAAALIAPASAEDAPVAAISVTGEAQISMPA